MHFRAEVGETAMAEFSDPDAMILQMGAFAQIYTGIHLQKL